MAKTSNYMRRLSLISLLYLQGLLEIWARSGYSVQSPFAASNPHRRLSSQAPQKANSSIEHVPTCCRVLGLNDL